MKAVIIYNPFSGNQSFKDEVDTLATELKKYNIEETTIYRSEYPKAITEYILKNGMNFDIIFLSGGDGTLNEAINAIMQLTKEERPKLFYLPSGTVNDVGFMLGLKKKWQNNLDLLNSNPVRMDVCQINNNYFTYVAGCGRMTGVSYDDSDKKSKKKFGKAYYYWRGIEQLTSKESFHLKITANNQTFEGDYYLFLALNTQHVGGFFIHRKKPIKLNDGKIDLNFFKLQKFASIFSMFNYFLFGDYLKFGIEEVTSNEFMIECERPLQLNNDGEKGELSDKVSVKVHQEAIEIYVSPKSRKRYF